MLVLVLALGAFEAGVGTTDRPGIPEAGTMAHLYYAIGLFVLGGLDLGMPIGGPDTARRLLWLAYFLAPLVTTTAVAEGALRMMRPDLVKRSLLKDHVLLVGMGRVGQRYLDALRRIDPDRYVLVVDADYNRRSAVVGRNDRRLLFLHADPTDARARRALRLEHACGVVLTQEDDLANLEIAWDLAQERPSLKIAALVADMGIRRGSSDLDDGNGPILFNVHRMVAIHLYKTALRELFHQTALQDTVIVAGFGRFGQTILEFLQTEAACELSRIVLVDLHADALAARFAERTGFHRHGHRDVIGADMTHPSTWEQVRALTQHDAHEPITILCSERDDLNLQTAMMLRRQAVAGRIFVRVFHDGAYVRKLAEHYQFDILAVDSTLELTLMARHRGWFLDGS